jgi:phage terminase large subunit
MPVKAEHRYAPRGACRVAMTARDPEFLLAGPAGTGKSRALLEKLHLMALANPGMRGLICRKTATTLSSTALVTWNRFVIAETAAAGHVRFYGGSAQEPPSYKYRNGSVIAIGGMDKVDKIMSSEYDVIYVQEATELTENDWEALTTRLRNWRVSFQQLMADCNPSAPTHWLKRRCDDGKTRMLISRHEDNPMLFTPDGSITEKGADYLSKLDALSGIRFQRLRLGNWVAAEGVIYEDFAQHLHVVSRESFSHLAAGEILDGSGIPFSWTRYWSVDFGFVHPFVLQCWAEDPDGRMYLYREIYRTRKTVDQHARDMLNVCAPCVKENCRHSSSPGTDESCVRQWIEPKPTTIVADHDAEGRAVLERELEMTIQPAHKAVTEGIEAVQVRMRTEGDGRPRIFLLTDAVIERDPELLEASRPTSTIEEIPGYVWNDKGKEEPAKVDDDGCDAMRYAIADRDFGIRAIYRSFVT